MSGIEAAFFGALGRDAESRTSKAGKQYLRLNIRAGDGDGAQWINITCFDQTAIEAADRLVKGARVYCEGSIKLDEWSASDGTKKHGLSCLSWHCRLAAIGRNRPKKSGETSSSANPANQPSGAVGHRELDDEIPF